jgi:hypothetical protein
MRLDEVRVRVTKGDIEEFKNSILWKDMRRELMAWKKGFNSELGSIVDNAATTNPSSATVLMHIGDINGRIKTVDYMLSLPDVFIGILESEEDKSRDKPTNVELGEDEPDGN